jgi:pyruvate dehydrogenase E1 component alpha subunit
MPWRWREGADVNQAPWIEQDDLSVETYQIVDPEGAYDPDAVPDLGPERLQDLYRWMLLERIFDERMVKLQRRGEMGTYASGRGQEASIVGSGYALEEDDWLLGMGREPAAMFLQGLSIRDLILFWRGVAASNRFLAAENCSIAISIGSHLPLAAGVAWGMALPNLDADSTSDSDAVAAAYFGDGATSTGAWHEGVNLAGVLEAPALFFCQNNQYAISLPFEQQTRAGTVAQRAVGYGIRGLRVDGNDVLAVYDAVSRARDLARTEGPVIVESLTYRIDAHTTSDDPSRYRSEAEAQTWKDRDPLDRYRAFLQAEGLWDDLDPEALEAELNEEIDAALSAAAEFESQDADAVFAHLSEELPPALQEQFQRFERLLEERPEIREHIEQRPRG